MASTNAQVARPRGTQVADRVATKVAAALKSDKTFESGSVALSAHIAGAAAAAVVNLPAETRQALNKRRAELGRRIRLLVEGFGEDPNARIALSVPDAVEASIGEGIGPVVTTQDGEKALAELAVARKIEDWAGPVAGPTQLDREFDIPRSSLNRWQHAGDVIALLKGTKKHVYPVEQFVDGRPARGLGEISRLASNQRVAWLWLSRANPVVGGRKPIDLLKEDRVGEVMDAAKAYFVPQ